MNDAGDYSPVLTDAQVTSLLNGSIRAEDVPADFSGLRPACPVMENQTVYVIPRVEDNETKTIEKKTKDAISEITPPVAAQAKKPRKFFSEDKK
jgi:hypothetical protein